MAEKEDLEMKQTTEVEKPLDSTTSDEPIEISKEETVEIEAPQAGEPSDQAGDSDIPDQEEIQSLIQFMNELDVAYEGKGDISEIPPNLVRVTKVILDKLSSLVTVFKDPVMKDIIDDLLNQRDEGKEPDVYLAIARTVPMDELEGVVDNENYDELQEATANRIKRRDDEMAASDALTENIEMSMKEFDAYCEEQNYDDTEKSELMATIDMLMSVFGDGKLTKDEYAKVDKMRNYDKDISSIKSDIPEEPVKEVLPEGGQTPEMIASKKTTVSAKPRTQLDTMSQMGMTTPAYKKMGRGRK